MKNNQPVTGREVRLSPTDALISTTGLKGVVQSVNDDFVRLSGFAEAELIGQAHNIVRHPDMPQAAFRDLWANLKQNRPWMGLVKNRCKNGDHYYVDAYVTPIYEGNNVTGYQSVRFQPDREVVDRAEDFYRALNRGGVGFWQKFLLKHLSYGVKAPLAAVVASLPVLVAALLGVVSTGGLWVAWLVTLGLGMLLAWFSVRPLLKAAKDSQSLFFDDIAKYVYSGRRDEVGQLQVVIKSLRAQNRTILGRVEYSAETLIEVAGETSSVVAQTTEGMHRQQREVEQMATAMNEMTATVGDVARSAERTAAVSNDVLEKTNAGVQTLQAAINDIQSLSNAVNEATTVIEQLRNESEDIGSVVDVISNIASETNLLALNAAIEAARAGEQGRGFAVVADEVRNLATNTQKSTDEIQAMIKSIQQSSMNAVEAMSAGQKRAENSVSRSNELSASFAEISRAIDDINNMNTQVATASEQQSAVSEEINRNVIGINEVAAITLEQANKTSASTKRLWQLVENLRSVVKQFGQL